MTRARPKRRGPGGRMSEFLSHDSERGPDVGSARPLGPVHDPASPRDASTRFQSLIELGHELTVALDVHETADLLLFNLMGQLRTSRSAVWLVPDEEGTPLPACWFARTAFTARSWMRSVRPARPRCASVSPPTARRPSSWMVREDLGAAEFELVRHAGVAVLRPAARPRRASGLDGSGRPESTARLLGGGSPSARSGARRRRRVPAELPALQPRPRECNRRLRATNEPLSELDQLKTDFLSNVNHELRTPLAVIIGSLECVVDLGSLDSRVQGFSTPRSSSPRSSTA